MGEQPDVIRFAGVDWGNEEHYACVVDAEGTVMGQSRFRATGDGLEQLTAWLTRRAGVRSDHVGVGIEITHGPVVDVLLERGFVVFALNPKQLDRFRDRFTVAGAKDDRRDARVLADSLRTDRRAFRQLTAAAPEIVELREWSRMAEDLTDERRRLVNRLRAQLRRYFPQALELTDDPGTEWFLRVLERIPTPAAARQRHHAAIGKILREHRLRKWTPQTLLATLRQTPLVVAPGTIEAATAHVRLVRERIRLVNGQLKMCLRRLDEICDEAQAGGQRDIGILRSFPGVGPIVLATLLAEAWRPLASRDYPVLRALCGVAPVTRRSGKRRLVLMRRACNGRLRNALYHWAEVAAQRDDVWKARSVALKKRGHSHARTCRALGDRLLAAAMAALRTQTLYDPTRLRQPSALAA